MRTTTALIVLCCVTACIADDTYRLSPFNPAYDTINQKTLRNFELLPQVPDTDILRCKAGTKSDAEAFARDYVMKTGIVPARFYTAGRANKTQGKHTIELYGPATIDRKQVYFWIVKGLVNHNTPNWPDHQKITKAPPEGYVDLYNLIFYYDNWATPKPIFYLVRNKEHLKDATICQQVAVIVEPELRRITQKRHDQAIKQDVWNTNTKPAEGILESYRNGRITIRTPKGSITSIDTAKLTLDDQELVRGYLDQLEIPVR